MSDVIASDIQQPSPGDLVAMYVIDATEYGGSLFRFVNGTYSDNAVVFDGNTYLPMPITAKGFKCTTASMPKPTLTCSNIDSQFVTALLEHNDLVGATFKRIQTFAQHLDNGSDPNTEYTLPIDEYRIDKKKSQDNIEITWQLATALDQSGVKLPRRQAKREYCDHTYRSYVNDEWDYSKATCPYVDSVYFNELGVGTDNAADDSCGRCLSDCQKRFGERAELPTRAMPGLAKVRT